MTDIQILKAAKRVYSSTPSWKFRSYGFTNGHNKCCFIGHYQRYISGNSKDYSNDNCTDYKNRRGIREVMAGHGCDLVLEHMRGTSKYVIIRRIRKSIKKLI